MSIIHHSTREIIFKIVYYGPGSSGKTMNLEHIDLQTGPESKGRLISLPTDTESTLFFDFLSLSLGKVNDFRVFFHLYTVPGQDIHNECRKKILINADGIVFVADSQKERMNSNLESMENLFLNFRELGMEIEGFPCVFQYNKRDLPDISKVEDLRKNLNRFNAPDFEAVAFSGRGVPETIKSVGSKVLKNI